MQWSPLSGRPPARDANGANVSRSVSLAGRRSRRTGSRPLVSFYHSGKRFFQPHGVVAAAQVQVTGADDETQRASVRAGLPVIARRGVDDEVVTPAFPAREPDL